MIAGLPPRCALQINLTNPNGYPLLLLLLFYHARFAWLTRPEELFRLLAMD